MQFNDNAIPTNESFNDMKQAYSKLGVFKGNKVETLAEKQVLNDEIYSLFTQEIDLLKILSSRSQNQNVREYLGQLGTKSEAELKKLVETFPNIDNSLTQNPTFYEKRSITESFKQYLKTDLEIVDNLCDCLKKIAKEEEKNLIFGMINRHVKALEELFSILHLLTFY